STAENIVKGGLAAGGVLTASALFSVTITAVLQALPMVQAMLLLGIYALLPMVVVLSRYSLSMMVVGAMAIFTVKFWSVLWYLAMWVDQNLIQSMYPDVNIFLQIFANPGEHDTKRMLLNMITTSLYLGLPVVWSGMMAWAGIQIGRSISAAGAPMVKHAEDAGKQGGTLGKSVVGRDLRR
ncbi:MAG: conjugal transfer protein TraG, partial [Gammaproteobacteria bacterium]|nr:conjugal transfer protein TraG [Gammaproteobacteria bacterium]